MQNLIESNVFYFIFIVLQIYIKYVLKLRNQALRNNRKVYTLNVFVITDYLLLLI